MQLTVGWEDLNQGPRDFKSSVQNYSATPPPLSIIYVYSSESKNDRFKRRLLESTLQSKDFSLLAVLLFCYITA